MQIHIHIHACKHTYIHTYVELYVHANDPHQCTHEHKRRHTHINVQPNIYIYIYPMLAHVYAEPTIWLNMRTYTHMPTCTPHVPIDQRVHARARINIYIYTYKYTCVYKRFLHICRTNMCTTRFHI